MNHVSEIIVFVLFLPVVLHIILPLGMLASWLVWRGLNLFIGEKKQCKAQFTMPHKEPAYRRPLSPG